MKEPEAYWRSVVIDWIMEVCYEMSYSRQTFHYTVHYINRIYYLHCTKLFSITRLNLQLIGTAGLFIAAKIEERYIPNLKTMSTLTENAYTTQQV
jgi:hypothetical protein